MHYSKSTLIIVAIVSCCVIALHSCAVESDEEKPNVVFIYLDDLDNTQLGCYGGNVKTPNIDQLAENGMKFTRYYPSSAVCTPSRYSALTGKYASRSTSEAFMNNSPLPGQAFVRWNTDISDADLTIAEVLRSAGYRTGFVGKWHLGFPNYQPLAISYESDPDDPEIDAFLKDNYKETADYVKTVSGFDEILSFYSINMQWIPVPKALDHHNQEWIDNGAVNFIESNKDKPFFLYVATTLPHAPQAISSLKNKPATPVGYDELSDEETLFRQQILSELEDLDDSIRMESYAAARWLDNGVGKIIGKLKELKLEENTIIIIASDNDNRGKMTCYDTRVPFIMQWKGQIAEGSICDELVSNIDFAPTIYDLCKVDLPEKAVIDGVSLQSLLNKDSSEWRSSLFMEVVYTRGVITKDWNYVAVRYPEKVMNEITFDNRSEFNQEGTRESANDGITTGQKVRYNSDKHFPAYFDFDQLFDLKNDPMEQVNLAYDIRFEIQLLNMKKLLKEYSARLPHSFGEFK